MSDLLPLLGYFTSENFEYLFKKKKIERMLTCFCKTDSSAGGNGSSITVYNNSNYHI